MKLRKICFTINNYSEEELVNLQFHIGSECIYGIIGREVGEHGTPHLQGYCEYRNPRSFKGLKEIFTRAHIEKKRGTNVQAADYCKKDLDFWESGTLEPESQGKRGDLQAISEHIQDNNGIRDMIECNLITSAQHLNVSEKLMKYMEPQRDRKPLIYWLFGPSGSGKTRAAIDACVKPWIANGSLQWFDGYDGQEDVIFDDFRTSDVDFHMLLRLLDRYPINVPIKGAYRAFKPLRIFITTPQSITETYNWIGEDVQQLHRRVDFEYEYKREQENNFSFGTEVTIG